MTEPSSLKSMLSLIEGRPLAMIGFARTLIAKGETMTAHDLCRRALALAPDDPEVSAAVKQVFSHDVPDWHFWILNDEQRNKAHDAALRRAVKPGCRVLEIGAGTGIYAMMAARAGAQEVVACEANAGVAAGSAEVIAQNGLQNRVKVVPKLSSDLQIGVDLSGPADVLLLGNAANNLVGDGILPALEQASRRLLHANAKVIPAAGVVRVALAEDREAEKNRLGIVEDFDLSSFNRLSRYGYQVKTDRDRFFLRSEPLDLFRFDFQSGGPFPEKSASGELVSQGGRVNGIAQWLRLEMDDEGVYENHPDPADAKHAWGVLFYRFEEPVETSPGDRMIVHGAHDRASLRIWAKPVR